VYLKKYQINVVKALKDFYTAAYREHAETVPIIKQYPHKKSQLDWVKGTFESLGVIYKDSNTKTGLGDPYPRLVIKVPTGGGKTLLAVEAIREYQDIFVRRRTGLIVWVVPTETIYTQTVQKLRDKSNYLRQLLDQSSGGKTLILEKGQRLSQQEINDNLVILFVMIQSVSRQNGKEALKVFQDSGGYEGFFPQDHRYDLHKQLIEQIPNLDIIAGADSAMPQIRTSLGNAIRVTNPLIIIDEIHKVFSDQQRNTINNLNPSMVLGFSATPRDDMNILVRISGLELKNEDMVKLDMHVFPPTSKKTNGWETMLKEIKQHREKLEAKAKQLQKNENIYIRPIALIQVEATGKDQRGRGRVHSLDAKENLINLGISADEIAIKTSSQNDIEDVDLFSRQCSIRYLITKEALKEGWDCSFAYILGVIPNVNSDTSIIQLIGRILRQPNAKKTHIRELDESYVYYAKGDSQILIDHVKAGFTREGLEDLIGKIKPRKTGEEIGTKPAPIKKEIAKKYRGSLYLPIWLIVEDAKHRRKLNYDIDIKSELEFETVTLTKEDIRIISEALSEETKERKPFAITLDEQSHTKYHDESIQKVSGDEINISYLTRRMAEIVENPFLARKKAEEFLDDLIKSLGKERLHQHFGFIVAELFSILDRYRMKKEELVFTQLLKAGTLKLTVSDDEEIGYAVPKHDEVSLDHAPKMYERNLYEYVEESSFNSLERKVAQTLDEQEKLVWWFRNKVSRGWYSIQGWRKDKIRPDFVAAKRKEDGTVELVYVLESKGEHLVGNADTEYKSNVLQKMTDTKIEPIQMEFKFGKVNDRAAFYIIEDGKEEEKVRSLFVDNNSLEVGKIRYSKKKNR
jgi:type III restriction enzyme